MLDYKKYIAIFFIFLFVGCVKKEDTLLEDMAVLDKEYIKTLLTTKNMGAENSKNAISGFIVKWNDFKKKYYNVTDEDPQWKTDFDSLQDILIRSHYYVSSGEDVSASYLILHNIKYVLSDLRKRNNIDWFVDYFNAIYKTAYRMQELSKIYKNTKSNSVFTPEEETKLQSVFNLLDFASQNTILKFDDSNINLFNLSSQKLNTIRRNIEAIDNIVRSIGIAISSKKYGTISNMCESIINIYFNTLQIIID